MVFDVMTRIGKNAAGKDILNVYRVHDSILSRYLREAQDCGKYIVSVIPLFRKKEQIIDRDEEDSLSINLLRKDIDPRLLKTVSKEPPYVSADSIGE
jgi:hypothetical protein